MADSWVERTIQLKANTVTEVATDYGKLMNTFIVKNLSQYPVFGSLKSTLTTADYEIQVQPGDYGIIIRPYDFQKVYLLSTADITVTVYMVWTQNPMILLPSMAKPVQASNVDVVQTVGLKAGELNLDASKNLGVNVMSLVPLPAGGNNIGKVDVNTLPPLPAGTNNIGKVDVNALPSLPAGTNNIGDVDIVTMPDVNLAGATGQKVTAAASGDVTVKASAGKVFAIRAMTGVNVTLKDGVTERWYTVAGDKDAFIQPINCATSIILNFSAAGDAWIIYQ